MSRSSSWRWALPTIAELLAQGRLERVAPDEVEARELLEHAVAHLRSAYAIAPTDAVGGYQLAYDAARKGVAAAMSARGYRAKSDRPGAHAAVVAYADEALAGVAARASLARFDGMRRLRNRAEYGGLTVSRAQLDADIEHAAELVRAVTAHLGLAEE